MQLIFQIAAGIMLGGVGLCAIARLNSMFQDYRRGRDWRRGL